MRSHNHACRTSGKLLGPIGIVAHSGTPCTTLSHVMHCPTVHCRIALQYLATVPRAERVLVCIQKRVNPACCCRIHELLCLFKVCLVERVVRRHSPCAQARTAHVRPHHHPPRCKHVKPGHMKPSRMMFSPHWFRYSTSCALNDSCGS